MQAFAGDIVADPVYGLIAAILVVGVLTVWGIHSSEARRKAGNPLQGLFEASTFDNQLDTVAERALRAPQRDRPQPAPMRGQRAQYARLREVWALDTREAAIEQVARVMRASNEPSPAPVRVMQADPVFDAVEWPAEWEEVKLLPPPASHAA